MALKKQMLNKDKDVHEVPHPRTWTLAIVIKTVFPKFLYLQ